MTVYVDLLFGLNTVINYLLLRASAAVGGCPAKLGRLLAAACLGGLYAVAAVLPGLEGLQGLLYQGVAAGVMLITAFGWKRNTVKQGLYFFALSFALSGLVLLVTQAVEPDCLLLGGRTYYAVSMPALLLLAGVSYGVAAVVLAGCGTHTGGDLVHVTLSLRGRSVELRALRDTGNTLRDPMTGQPVLVVSGQVLQRLLPQLQVTAQELKTPQTLMQQYPHCGFRLIPYHSVGTEHGLLLAVRCAVQYGKKSETILTAFSPTVVSADGRFEALWGGAVK